MTAKDNSEINCDNAESIRQALKLQQQDLKICQVITSDKSNLLRKVDFFLKSGFQAIALFIPLKLGYLVEIKSWTVGKCKPK